MLKDKNKILLKDRIKALDTARGYATCMMVLGHYIQWYLKSKVTPSLIHYIFVSFLGISAQNLFVTLPAMGVILQLEIYRNRGIDENQLRKSIIKRGLLLILFQYFCNALFQNPAYSWNWFILSFIGVSIIFTYFISRLSHRNRFLIVIAIVILSPFLKYYFYSLFNTELLSSNTWSINEYLYGLALQIVFPLFPSIVYPILGSIFADRMIKAVHTNSQLKFVRRFMILGAILLFSYFILQNFYPLINYPDFLLNLPSRLDVLYVFGTILLIILFFYLIQDLNGKNLKIFKPFEILGNISLTVFITHFYFFPKFFESLYSAQRNTSFYSILEFTFIILIFYLIYGIWVQRNKRKFSVEWFLRSLI